MDLKKKVWVISGASSGIGKAVAENLAAKGAKVALLARRAERLKGLADSLAGSGQEALAVPTDVTDRDQVAAAVAAVREKFGRIDGVINNAGVGYFGTVEKLPMAEWDRLVQTNVYGLINLSQLTIPALKESQGMIVNISSGLSKRALPFLTAYASTKSMVDALSEGMRLELKKYGVKVLNYCPPETESEIFENTHFEPGLAHGQVSHGKPAKAVDVAGRIVAAMAAEKREVVEGRSLQIMNFFAPGLLDKMFYKGMVQKILKD